MTKKAVRARWIFFDTEEQADKYSKTTPPDLERLGYITQQEHDALCSGHGGKGFVSLTKDKVHTIPVWTPKSGKYD